MGMRDFMNGWLECLGREEIPLVVEVVIVELPLGST